MDLLAVLAASFLGSAHCIGMCGGLAAAIGVTDRPFWPTFGGHLVYTIGRISTYACLGAAGGLAGLYLSQFRIPLIGAQHVFSALAGAIMILVGLSLVGLIPPRRKAPGSVGGMFAPLFAHFLSGRGLFGRYMAGLATGFLPCGFVYAFLAMAIAEGGVTDGILLMTCFGLGTAPAMIAIGCGGTLLSRSVRLRAVRVAACLVILMGGMMVYRAMPHENGHCPHGRGNSQAGIDPGSVCRYPEMGLRARPAYPRGERRPVAAAVLRDLGTPFVMPVRLRGAAASARGPVILSDWSE